MAEYRALRERYSLLDICRSPDLATEVTLQPVRRVEVDAAILFSDLLLPLEPMGLPFDFIKGEGPQIERPIESPADIDRLRDVRSARVARSCARGDPADPARACRTRSADRVCGRALYARVVCDRGRPFEQLRAHQGADVRPPRRLASALCASVDRRLRLPDRADRRRRRRRPALRLVGRRAECRRLPRVRDAAHAAHLRGDRPPRPDDSLRHRNVRHPRGAARGGRRRRRRRLADTDRYRLGAHRA